MKKYILFEWNKYYPIGGLGDIQRDFDAIEEAKEFKSEDGMYDYRKIVDRDTWEVVWEAVSES